MAPTGAHGPCSFKRMVQGEACSLSAFVKQKPSPTEQSWCLGAVGRLNPHLFWGWRGGTAPGFAAFPGRVFPWDHLAPFHSIQINTRVAFKTLQLSQKWLLGSVPERVTAVRPHHLLHNHFFSRPQITAVPTHGLSTSSPFPWREAQECALVPSGAEKQCPFSSKRRHWSPLTAEVGLRAKNSLQHRAAAVAKPHGAEFWHLPAPGWRREPIPGTGWARAGSGARGPPARDQMAQVTLCEVLFFFTTLQKNEVLLLNMVQNFPSTRAQRVCWRRKSANECRR